MEKGLRIAVVLIGASMLLGAVGFMFSPEAMEAQFSVVASRVDGMGTLRGDLGGLFLTLAVFTLYGSRPGKSAWLAVPVVFMLTVLLGRTVHIMIDGLSEPAIRSTVIEIIGLVLLEAARRKLDTDKVES
jgi:hypothetical protein|tara:strand:- start:4128 stop:4517 length:390 start_codon:yes stop_codon:yes gene_type:complete